MKWGEIASVAVLYQLCSKPVGKFLATSLLQACYKIDFFPFQKPKFKCKFQKQISIILFNTYISSAT